MDVEFNRKKLIKFLNSKNKLFHYLKKLDVFFPVLVDLEKNSFNYLNDNIFVEKLGKIKKNYFQIKYILPNEDVEDYFDYKNNFRNIENYNF